MAQGSEVAHDTDTVARGARVVRLDRKFRWPGGRHVAVVLNVAYEGWSDGKAPGIGPMGNPLPAGAFDTNALSWGSYGAIRGIERLLRALDRTKRRFDLKPKRLAADTAYGTGRFLGWLVGCRIVPHIPVRDASQRDDGTFSRSDFRWDRRRGVYICPNDKVLRTTGTVHDGNTLRYRASKFDCNVCALKVQCCPNTPVRQVPRDIHEHARDITRRLMRTKAFIKSIPDKLVIAK